MVNFCEAGVTFSTEMEKCRYYENKKSMDLLTISAPSWKAAFVLYTVSSLLLGLSGLIAALCLCVHTLATEKKVTFVAGYFQLIAGEY